MATNSLMARREIPARERTEKIITALLVYAGAIAGTWYYFDGKFERFSFSFWIITTVSVVCMAFVFNALRKNEAATSKDGVRLLRMRIADDRAGRSWLTRTGFNIQIFFSRLIFSIGVGVVLCGLYILVKQTWTFTRAGHWPRYTMMNMVEPWMGWLVDTWDPLRRLIVAVTTWLPAFVVLLLLGALISGFGSGIGERFKHRRATRIKEADRYQSQQ